VLESSSGSVLSGERSEVSRHGSRRGRRAGSERGRVNGVERVRTGKGARSDSGGGESLLALLAFDGLDRHPAHVQAHPQISILGLTLPSGELDGLVVDERRRNGVVFGLGKERAESAADDGFKVGEGVGAEG
jgi:hypothetical protein